MAEVTRKEFYQRIKVDDTSPNVIKYLASCYWMNYRSKVGAGNRMNPCRISHFWDKYLVEKKYKRG